MTHTHDRGGRLLACFPSPEVGRPFRQPALLASLTEPQSVSAFGYDQAQGPSRTVYSIAEALTYQAQGRG
jgi:hypothetical protein